MSKGKKIFYPKIYPLNRDLSKEWQVRYFTPTESGQLKKVVQRIPKKLKTVAERESWSKQFLHALEFGLETELRKANLTLESLFSVLNSMTLRPKTRSTYKGHLIGFNEFCLKNQIGSITEGVASDFLEHLKQTHEGRTVNHYRRTLRALFAVLKKNKEIKKNPFEQTDRAPTKKAFSEHFNDVEMKLITDKVKEMCPNLLFPMMVILHCATRNGQEMPNLRVKDVDFENGFLWIDKEFAKNKEREKIKIPQNLLLLMQQMKIHTFDKELYLFGRNGTPAEKKVGQNYFNNQFRKVLKELGIYKPKKGFYRLKNSLGVKLVKQKTNHFAIQKQFRHKSIVTTEKYLASLSVEDFPELENFSFF